MQNLNWAGSSVLIVDDEPLLRRQLISALQRWGADVTGAGTLAEARRLIDQLSFDFVLLDVSLPDGRGTELLQSQVFSPATCVIVMTADGGVAGAVEAMRLGAMDYLVKPFDPAELPLVFNRARRAKQSVRLGEHRRSDDLDGSEVFFFGRTLAPLEAQLQKILAADRRGQCALPPVLIQGETGTGKTTIARWIHHHGPQAGQPLVEVNCSALPETLAESELFGHERGAFTDARSARMGLFEAAAGGTLFLDELPSLSLALQAKVLGAIEDRLIRRLGGNKAISVDVRVIAATNRNLDEMVAQGRFREDLLHRLDLYRVHIPPLRTRRDDILKLAELLLSRLYQRHRMPSKRISEHGGQQLCAYPWPGNVRELAHELERAIVFSEGEELDFDHLAPADIRLRVNSVPSVDWLNEGFVIPPEGFSLEMATNRLIRLAMKQTNDNVSAAAKILGIGRDALRYRLASQKTESDPAVRENTHSSPK